MVFFSGVGENDIFSLRFKHLFLPLLFVDQTSWYEMQSPFTPSLQSQTLLQRRPGVGASLPPAVHVDLSISQTIHTPRTLLPTIFFSASEGDCSQYLLTPYSLSRGRGSKVRCSISRYRFLDGTFATIAAKRKDAYVSIKACFFKTFFALFPLRAPPVRTTVCPSYGSSNLPPPSLFHFPRPFARAPILASLHLFGHWVGTSGRKVAHTKEEEWRAAEGFNVVSGISFLFDQMLQKCVGRGEGKELTYP